VVWAIWLIGVFYLFTPGARVRRDALLPPGTVTAANQNDAAPLLAYASAASCCSGLISAIAVRDDPRGRSPG
jgi:cation/acetate symporter